jgi:hypothetical protein
MIEINGGIALRQEKLSFLVRPHVPIEKIIRKRDDNLPITNLCILGNLTEAVLAIGTQSLQDKSDHKIFRKDQPCPEFIILSDDAFIINMRSSALIKLDNRSRISNNILSR